MAKKAKLKVPPGEVRFTALLRAFLGADPAITVGYNDKMGDIEVTVTGCPFKAERLEQILVKKLTKKSKWCTEDHRILVNGKRCSYKEVLMCFTDEATKKVAWTTDRK